MWEGPRVEPPGGLHPRGCVWCDLSGVEGEIGESLLRFQGQGCAAQGLEDAEVRVCLLEVWNGKWWIPTHLG